jgi:[pyruvate, water dikinase]-phosphate phosphotransferase / [pyruvate, water dikinase] kinase
MTIPGPGPIYIISGGKGITGNFLVQTVLAQFPQNRIAVKLISDVVTVDAVNAAVAKVVAEGGIIVHTMIDKQLRESLNRICREKNIKTIDMAGDLIDYLTAELNEEPLNQPGLYRKLNLEYFDRLESIDFAISNDDGLNVHNLRNADIVLAGVSRTGKTPLSVYLAMHGWKVSNVPLVLGMDPPEELFKVDEKRVFGLTTSMNQLLSHRRKRIQDYEHVSSSDYVNPRSVRMELDFAHAVFKRGGFSVISVTHKPIESVANEILELIYRRFERKFHKR